VLALPEHLDGIAVGHGFSCVALYPSPPAHCHVALAYVSRSVRVTIWIRYTNELIEQTVELIVSAVTKIDCINAPGLRQLHVDLDYVANCCR
jgi:hypothetical protein